MGDIVVPVPSRLVQVFNLTSQPLKHPSRRKVTHPFIIFIVICGADDFVGITDFAEAMKGWLESVLDLFERHFLSRPIQCEFLGDLTRRV